MTWSTIFKILFLLFLFTFVYGNKKTVNADEDFGFASVFHENMVLQMEPYRAVVWGYGTVGAIVNLTLIQDVYSTKVKEGPNGRGIWLVTLRSHPAGGPHTFQGIEDNHGLLSWILLKGVLFGDVWVCGGQSNMQFTLGMAFNATEELAQASKYPNIRVMTPAQVTSDKTLFDLQGIEEQWSIPSEATLGGTTWTYFSAVCWLYGRYLYDNIKVPIGLVSSNWGGTAIETWSSHRALKKCKLNHKSTYPLKMLNDKAVPKNNSVLWNAMIHPLLNMTIKGAIWYQGEANMAYHNAQYSCSFPSMIEDWRKSWHEGTGGQTHTQFPFGFVQLSTVNVPDDGSFPLIRWHQTADYGYVPNPRMPNTFMAVAMDLPDDESPYGSIHPRDKQDVASRLVRGSLKVAYGQHTNPQGPIPDSAVRSENGVVLTYPNEQRLVVSEEGNFVICCNISKCDYTEPSPSPDWLWAPVTSHTHRTITLSAKGCTSLGGHATMLRYGWALTPCKFKSCSVYNDEDLPAPPYVIKVVGL